MGEVRLPDVKSKLWSMSITRPGYVVTELDVLRQRIYYAILTPLGSDVLRPQFGTRIFEWLAKPINVAVANIKKEIVDVLTFYVKEVKVDKIPHKISADGSAELNVLLTINNEEELIQLIINGGSVSFGGIKGIALVAEKLPIHSTDLSVSLTVDNVPASPTPPGYFADVTELTEWVVDNWSAYGDWGVGEDVMILYLDEQYRNVRFEING